MISSAATTASLMEQLPDADNEILIARLMESGIAESEAHELIAFVPLAFGRYAFRNSGVGFFLLFRPSPRWQTHSKTAFIG
jgi:hypothetical protein